MALIKSQAGTSLVQALIGGGALAGILLYLSQIMVNTKDLQKKHENKLLFKEDVRFINDILIKSTSCRCMFSEISLRINQISNIPSLRLFKDQECKEPFKSFGYLKAELKELALISPEEVLATLELVSTRKGKLTKSNPTYKKSMKFKVVPTTENAYKIVSCASV